MDYLLSRELRQYIEKSCTEARLILLFCWIYKTTLALRGKNRAKAQTVDCTTTLLKQERFSETGSVFGTYLLLLQTVFSSKIQTVL